MTIRTQILGLNQDEQEIATLLKQINAPTLRDPRVMQAAKVLINEVILSLDNEIDAEKQALKQYVAREFSKLATQYPNDDLSFTLRNQDCGFDLTKLAEHIRLYNRLVKTDTHAKIDTIIKTLEHEDLGVTPVNGGLTLSLKR